MLERFIEATTRKTLNKLCCFKMKGDEIVCSEHTVNREWLNTGVKSENYYNEDYLESLRCYEVEDKILEIITKIYALSTVGLSKDEIVKNLKKKYNEDDINSAISFLKNNNLIEEYLGIPYKNEVMMEIGPRDICYTGKESKKFYTAQLYYTQNIAKIGSKTPKIHLSYKLFNIPYFFYISSTPLCFEKIPKYKWDVDLLSTYGLYQRVQFDIIDKFMPETCVIENELRLLLEDPKEIVPYENINPKDGETVKKRLLKKLSKRIKLFGGKNIVVKDKGPFEANIKYMLRKEMILPIITSSCVEHILLEKYKNSHRYVYLHTEIMREKNNIWRLRASSNFANVIRKRKKGEKDDYFFIDDESEEFDDIVIEDERTYNFPCDFKTKFIDYVTKKFKSFGVKINVINKKFE